MKYYVISGERSGDLHASNLIRAIRVKDDTSLFRGMGGNYSIEAGLDATVHYQEVAVMGFLEVLLGFRKVLRYLSIIKKDVEDFKPDVVILVDYGGFNLKIAAHAKKLGLKVHYYIPPKIWAWNQGRAKKLAKITDGVYCILPFEEEFFKGFGIQATYVGNPLLDEIQKFEGHPFFFQKNELSYQPIIALLPGSRKQEVKAMLGMMIELVPKFPNAQFVIAGVSNLEAELYTPAVEAGIRLVVDQTYDLLKHSVAAVVTSGTATLETALFRVPQVVVYRTSAISYHIGKHLIRVPFISLVNLIAGKKIVTELIQKDYSVDSLTNELNSMLSNVQIKAAIYEGYDLIKEKIGTQSASDRTAEMIVDTVRNPS
ncbi:lipid-A-disaccharide synthase [Mongoliitalea daihaiensis]|uniref:lipid-A-disaccharide synthase n=1 Tax=Mongoliitalea daihaiensis TaxID=2782006 RepID=UPI001F3140E6|nr:lipid-A-disaccharide synthase [Mongoliitalea daihaiensis]UJP65202.1 lipid-A-disaccharide synthase [Mongoliitalea daihaiensis]